jgi:hypothetical protein
MCNTYFLTRGDPSPAVHIVWQTYHEKSYRIIPAAHIVWQEFKKNSPPVSEFEYCLANVIPPILPNNIGEPQRDLDSKMFLPNNILHPAG